MRTLTTKITKAILLALVLMIAICISMICTVTNDSVYAAESEAQKHEAKIYSNTTIEDDFDDSCVLVVMDKYTGGINKKHADDFFGSFSKKSIKDLTHITGDVEKNDLLDKENFHQILKIELKEKSKENAIKAIKQLEKIDGILWAGPNSYDSPYAQPTIIANGDRYPAQWGLHDTYGIKAEQAWDITTGIRSNVRVGVIDSGIASHSDLNANVIGGWDFVNNNSITNDDPTGHGTHVAGIIGAKSTNIDGISGVCWNVQLVPLQVENNEGDWELDDVTEAINWAINNNVHVINYSGGGSDNYAPRSAAISNYQGVFVCAVGNDGLNNDNIDDYPANYSRYTAYKRVISVGAINGDGTKASYSNYGANSVSIFAPGTDILSTVPTSIDSSGYISWPGTSMATPHVAGTAALMVSLYSTLPHQMTRAEISASIKTAIVNNASKYSALSNLCVADGRLNAFAAIKALGFSRQAFSGFGYSGSTYYWNGKVTVDIDKYDSCYLNSSNQMVFTKNTYFHFNLSTVSSHNAWSKIDGTITYKLKNSAGQTISTHVSNVHVSIVGDVTLDYPSFLLNTATLSNGTYTLTLTSVLKRGTWTDTDTKTLTFIVNKT